LLKERGREREKEKKPLKMMTRSTQPSSEQDPRAEIYTFAAHFL
jgi:hypothetical protein